VKKMLLAGVSLGAIALATGSQAADLPARPAYKAPALAPAPWSWTGFYVGANVGAVWGRSSVSDDPNSPSGPWIGNTAPGTADANHTGVIGGLQAGYNWQFASLVLGLEGDISFSSLDRTVCVSPIKIAPDCDNYKSQLSALGTARGRIGWAFDRLLVYGTGGAAFASLKDEYNSPDAPFTASSRTDVAGWTAGGGLEYAFADHWTARAEYLHVGFPDRSSIVGIPSTTFAYGFIFKDSLDIARVGINYKF
jgi:outer membrane immunogenic protein